MARPGDDDEFERAMAGLGVKRTQPARPGRKGPIAPSVVEDIDFEAAMRELPDGRAPKAAPGAAAGSGEATAGKTALPAATRAGVGPKVEDAPRYAATAEEKQAFLAAVGAVAIPKEEARRAVLPAFDAEALLRRLRRGQVEPDASLDLHGRNKQQALAEVKRFVDEARAEKWRVVRVVVGKGLHSEGGDAIVGPAVERWLAEGPALEVIRAPTHLGGAGALLAVLRLD